MLTFFVITSVIFFVLLCLSVYLNSKLIKTVFSVESQVEESLDILDRCYGDIARTANTEILSDEPLIRNVMTSIRAAKDAILLVANKLVIFGVTDEQKK